MKRNRLVLIALLVGALAPVGSASQAGKELAEADAALNLAYRAVLASIHDPAQRAMMVSAQKAWLEYRDKDVAFFAERYPDSKGGLFYNVDLINQRTESLKKIKEEADSQ